MRTTQLYFSGFAALALLTVACTTAAANTDARRERMRQEAQAAFGDIEQTLAGILENVNRNQQPDERLIQDAADLLHANRRNAPLYDSPERATFMLLQSWTAYYQDDPANTMNWAVRACREDTNNGDAWITQTLFSLIHGRRPLEPSALQQQRPPGERRPQQRPRRGRQTAPAETAHHDSSVPSFGRAGVLDFDLSQVRFDLLGSRVPVTDMLDGDSGQIANILGGDIFCVLIAPGTSGAEPNEPGQPRRQGLAEESHRPFDIPTNNHSPHRDTGSGRDAQQVYFQGLRSALNAHKGVVFFEIDPGSLEMLGQLAHLHQAALPDGLAENAGAAAAALSQMQGLEPFMVIADSGGQVRYAGVAGGFMPAFILTHLTDVPIDLDELKPATDTPGDTNMSDYEFGFDMDRMPHDSRPIDPNAPRHPADPNQVADPNQPAAAHQTIAPEPEQEFAQLPEHQRLEAERQVAYIRDFFMRAPRTGGMTYKRGVDMCREVIDNYPGTEYAHQARQLLRQVPERHRRRYHITDEELGL